MNPARLAARLNTPTDLSEDAIRDISEALNGLLADTFALYLKTKNFHWHVSGPHFRDYHLLLDEQAAQIEASIDVLAERVRKIGGMTIRSIGHIARLQRVKDNDEEFVLPGDMLCELMADNKAQIENMRKAHKLADDHEDVATASLLEVFIDEAEKRCWFLFEASRGHRPHRTRCTHCVLLPCCALPDMISHRRSRRSSGRWEVSMSYRHVALLAAAAVLAAPGAAPAQSLDFNVYRASVEPIFVPSARATRVAPSAIIRSPTTRSAWSASPRKARPTPRNNRGRILRWFPSWWCRASRTTATC